VKLLAVVTFPGWRLRSYNERLHWAVRRKANQPQLMNVEHIGYQCVVAGPHKRRRVEVTRFGPREMDTDNLVASVKPCLDRIKCKPIHYGGVILSSNGYIFDDSPKYCKLVVRQEKGPYGVRVRVYG
jgi:hypothetical protein